MFWGLRTKHTNAKASENMHATSDAATNPKFAWLSTPSCRIRSDSQTTGLSLPVPDNLINEDGPHTNAKCEAFFPVVMSDGGSDKNRCEHRLDAQKNVATVKKICVALRARLRFCAGSCWQCPNSGFDYQGEIGDFALIGWSVAL